MSSSKNRASAITALVGDDDASVQDGPSDGGWKQSVWKNYSLHMAVEFMGTFLFLFFAFGGAQASQYGGSDQLLYIAVSFGLSLTANVWVFYRVSGGLFNPAITLGFVVIGAMGPLKGALLAGSQVVGGIAASALVSALLPGPLTVGTALAPGVSIVQGLFLEVFLTAELMITIFLLAVEKHRATFIAPLGIGLSFFITQLLGIPFTGASLNPVRSFGPAVVTGDFPGYHWIYWLGPVLGACLSAGVYKFLLFAKYQTVNPGQDDNGLPSYAALITEMRKAGRITDLENLNN